MWDFAEREFPEILGDKGYTASDGVEMAERRRLYNSFNAYEARQKYNFDSAGELLTGRFSERAARHRVVGIGNIDCSQKGGYLDDIWPDQSRGQRFLSDVG